MRKVMGLVAAGVVAACGGSSKNTDPPPPPGPTPAAAPTFSVAAGMWTEPISVTLRTSTPDATVRYTTDGLDPSSSSSVYAAPLVLAAAATVKAIATAPGYAQSAVATAAYAFQVATPTFSLAAGSYTTPRSVEIATTTPGAELRYTTDGAEPTGASSIYTAPIPLPIPSTTTLRAVGVRAGFTDSAVQAATYTMTEEPTVADFVTFCTSVRDTSAALEVACRKANPAIFPAALHDQFYCAEMDEEVTAGRVLWDPVLGASCVALVVSSGCSDLHADTWMSSACRLAVTGTVANGGTCYTDEDCAGEGECTGSCPGICRARAGEGESCATVDCADGLQCVDIPVLGPATCMTRSAAGGSCPCLEGLWCDVNGGPMGKCMDPKTAGTCGQSPLPPEYTRAECAVGYACHGGQCTSIAGSGESCVTHPCGEGYTCTGGVCTAWPPVGQPCVGTEPCAGGYCAAGTCTAYKARGDPCDAGTECFSRTCTGGHCAGDMCL